MGINIRTKGQEGEREICKLFNGVYKEVYELLGKTLPDKDIAQRNQNQSAVGGCDISNTCGLAIEVKRQEALSINTWWKQCEISAIALNKFPVLIFRQSKQKWRVMLYVNQIRLFQSEKILAVRAEITMDDFLVYFKDHAINYIQTYGKES